MLCPSINWCDLFCSIDHWKESNRLPVRPSCRSFRDNNFLKGCCNSWWCCPTWLHDPWSCYFPGNWHPNPLLLCWRVAMSIVLQEVWLASPKERIIACRFCPKLYVLYLSFVFERGSNFGVYKKRGFQGTGHVELRYSRGRVYFSLKSLFVIQQCGPICTLTKSPGLHFQSNISNEQFRAFSEQHKVIFL